jgi:hypothetical protein
MIDPGSAADWAQASLMTGVLALLTGAGIWALRREQHERLVAPRPNTQAVAMTGKAQPGSTRADNKRR